uniref:Permease n=1 Tax=Chromera velia CCMP2878 TaxID=1169474 RepID=A0A0G4G602_9ALVE|eukprot:Cvel_20330.t1-p1 / transcript=Cvel_20330.t1 / gene=Cvel_20330 / organism=Chromera_velia_CCMP2878 / gene_product=hypothetical protein / transcript_product=hypothetical protein / location=Cvel_scaffold1816:7252-8640(+) / protein_length=463 / sequence_SO=supercontig / SO=protein_coding / is_pseudo=false
MLLALLLATSNAFSGRSPGSVCRFPCEGRIHCQRRIMCSSVRGLFLTALTLMIATAHEGCSDHHDHDHHDHGHTDEHVHGHHHDHHHGHHHHHHHEAAASLSLPDLALAFKNSAIDLCPWLLTGLVVTVVWQDLLGSLLHMSSLSRFLMLDTKGGTGVFTLMKVCVTAALLGLAVPLCSCGAVPLALALSASGHAPAAVVTFLTAAQSAGVDSFVLSVGLLGWSAAFFRLVGASVISISAGMAVGRVPPRVGAAENGVSKKESSKGWSWWGKVRRISSLLREVWPVLTLGLVASTVAERVVGAGGLTIASQFYGSDFVLRTSVIVLSLPFQLCEHGVVSFAQALHRAGASPGLCQAFLLVAPATNVTTIAAVLRSAGNSAAVAVRCVVGICGAALAISYFTDFVLADSFDLSMEQPASAFELPSWWVNGSVYVVGALLIFSFVTPLLQPGSASQSDAKKKKNN